MEYCAKADFMEIACGSRHGKSVVCLGLLALVVLAFDCPSDANAAPIPVAWWRMNEATSGPISVGQIQDFGSGGNSTNLVFGDPNWMTAGVLTDPPFADGRGIFTDDLTDAIDFGQGAGGELRITGDLTLWGRVKLGFSGGASIAEKSSSGTGSYRLLVTEGSSPSGPSGGVSFSVSELGGTFDHNLIASAGSFPTTDWFDIAAVFCTSSGGGSNDGVISLYRNGDLVVSESHDLTGIFDSTKAFDLGNSLPLSIEQFRVYDQALTSDEVRSLTIPEPSALLLCLMGSLAVLGSRGRLRLARPGH